MTSERTVREMLSLLDRIVELRARRAAALDDQIALLERARETYPLVLDRELARLRNARDASIDNRVDVCFERVSRATPRGQCKPIEHGDDYEP